MLSFTMHLSPEPVKDIGFDSELTPIAAADYAIRDNRKCLLITLKSVILEDNARLLSVFFDDILALPAERWLLQLQDLRCISGAGLRNLARFVHFLRRRGSQIEIVGIHKNVYHMLSNSQEVAFEQIGRRRFSPPQELQLA